MATRQPERNHDLLNDSSSVQTAAKLANEGAETAAAGIDDLRDAREAARTTVAATAAAASDLTRAVDAAVVADRLAVLGSVVAAAGATDLAQGAELLAAADDVDTMSAVVGLLSVADLERGLQLGRLAGELGTISEVVTTLQMPVLAAVLDDRSTQLQGIAADVIVRAAATRSLGQIMAATGKQLGTLGAGELDEGALRVAAAELAAERSAELNDASELLVLRGAAEAVVAQSAAAEARAATATGVTAIAAGAAEMGVGATLQALAEPAAAAGDGPADGVRSSS